MLGWKAPAINYLEELAQEKEKAISVPQVERWARLRVENPLVGENREPYGSHDWETARAVRSFSGFHLAAAYNLPLYALKCLKQNQWAWQWRNPNNPVLIAIAVAAAKGSLETLEYLIAFHDGKFAPDASAQPTTSLYQGVQLLADKSSPSYAKYVTWLHKQYPTHFLSTVDLEIVRREETGAEGETADKGLASQAATVLVRQLLADLASEAAVNGFPDGGISGEALQKTFGKLTPTVESRLLEILGERRPDLLTFISALKGANTIPWSRAHREQLKYETFLRSQCTSRAAFPGVARSEFTTALVQAWNPLFPWEILPTAESESKYLTLFADRLADGITRPQVGQRTICSADEFALNWKAFTAGALDGFDFTNTVVAGGSIVTCLSTMLPEGTSLEERTAHLRKVGGTDSDLFFVGHLTYTAYHQELGRFIQYLKDKFKGELQILLTSKTLTAVLPKGMPRLQVGIGAAASLHDILLNADVDCCSVGFDGKGVWFTARGYEAWRRRLNVPETDLHRIRGSPVYEKRLLKYAERGFAVIDFGVEADNPNLIAFKSRASKAEQQRLLFQCGLEWLLSVDMQGATTKAASSSKKPTDVLTAWDESPTMTIAQLRELALSGNYTESDNYGNHEEGYRVAIDSELFPDLADRIDRWAVLSIDALADNDEILLDRPLENSRAGVKGWYSGVLEARESGNADDDENEEEYD
jgi:hypothetical protein